MVLPYEILGMDEKGFILEKIPTFADPTAFPAGRRRQNPFRIVALALDRALGDFAALVCYAASVKEQFDHAKLAVYFRNDRPYKRDILSACPHIDEIFEMTGTNSLPLDVMDRANSPTVGPPNYWYSVGWNCPHLLVTPSMATYGALTAFHQSARFRIPDETVDEMGRFLVSAGVDPDRWFCVTHFREGVYWDRPSSPFRDPQPEAFEDLAHFVIDDLGGQVVRIGDPSMSQFPEREGLVDLTNIGAGRFSHHLFAISRARFMLASNSGPGICGSAFGTPTAMVNNSGQHSVWNPTDAAMWCHILAPDGRRITHEVATKREMYFSSALNHLRELGFEIQQQSVAELKALASLMQERTSETTSWRTQWHEGASRARPNAFTVVAEPAEKATYILFSDLAPGQGTIKLKNEPF